MWDFLRWIMEKALFDVNSKLTTILNNQQTILSNQEELKRLLMGAIEKLNEFAVKVNDLTNAEAAAVTAIVAAIEDLKAKLVAAATAAEVDAILAGPLANLEVVANTLTAVAANNQPVVPPIPPPPVEEPL